MKSLKDANFTEEVKVEAEAKADAQLPKNWNAKSELKGATRVRVASQGILV